MSYFMADPDLVLETAEDVRTAIAEDWRKVGYPDGANPYRIKSLWLVSIIAGIQASGNYAYNATVKKLAEQGLGFPPKSEAAYAQEGDTLSLLVYNAQQFKRSDDLRAAGFEPATRDLLTELGAGGVLWNTRGVKLTIKPLQTGELVLFLPRKRRSFYAPDGFPVSRTAPLETP